MISSTTTVTFYMGAGGGTQTQHKPVTLPEEYDPDSSYILMERVNAREKTCGTEVWMENVTGASVDVYCKAGNEGNIVYITIRFVGTKK